MTQSSTLLALLYKLREVESSSDIYFGQLWIWIPQQLASELASIPTTPKSSASKKSS